MSDNGKFDICYPIEYRTDDGEIKTRWIKIGRATELPDKLMCRIDSIPVNWNGEFILLRPKG